MLVWLSADTKRFVFHSLFQLKEFADKHKTTTTDTSNQPGPSTTTTTMPVRSSVFVRR